MGGGGKSSSSNTTNTTTVSGTNAVQGDNLGVILSGIQGSVGNITVTDQGAVNAAKETAKQALETSADTTKETLSFGKDSLKEAFSFGEKSLSANKSAIDAIKAVANQASENTRTALAVADAAKQREQTGLDNRSYLTKFAIAACVVGGVLGVVALRGK
ncbi:hypothetical protein SBX64_05715 [Vibrio rhizosphaerae]|uniref:Methyl-accepting chemotaxis protein n=1 Tax=Vibrio rhizosphaerae TaxID=398736 RepID=A0ABU4IRL3_9VIBR|nr:hypothetical protein [Vibrio rhizosphaerae]MDW6092036.1 hypothetical protein [Vibrio rhizosphaerae]